MKDFWYFGCKDEPGHYLFTMFDRVSGIIKDDSRMGFPTNLLDGTFAPMEEVPGSWRLVTIHGCNEPLTIFAGWDRSVDKRGRSNAAFIAHGVHTVEEMLDRAKELFPKQYERLFLAKEPWKLVAQ